MFGTLVVLCRQWSISVLLRVVFGKYRALERFPFCIILVRGCNQGHYELGQAEESWVICRPVKRYLGYVKLWGNGMSRVTRFSRPSSSANSCQLLQISSQSRNLKALSSGLLIWDCLDLQSAAAAIKAARVRPTA